MPHTSGSFRPRLRIAGITVQPKAPTTLTIVVPAANWRLKQHIERMDPTQLEILSIVAGATIKGGL